MNLRAYVSNSMELNKYFETNEHCKASETQKLLGLQWNTVHDTIFIRLPDQPTSDIRWTKRKVLKCIASIYDPLGLLSSTVLIGKLFLQSLWKIELSWDELIPAEYVANWKRITSSCNSLGLCVPRRLFDEDENIEVEYDLHVFTDASAAVYCASAYIVRRRINGSSSASLIMSKSRLAPLNHAITIPRFELAAMMIGSKLLTFVVQNIEVHVSRNFLWTDSSVALTWIRCNNDLPISVKDRVKVILKNMVDVNVRHIPESLNPADIGSRGATSQELLQLTSWWKGPDFLTSDEDSWPGDLFLQNQHYGDKPGTARDELPQDSANYCFPAPTTETTVLEASKFSSWKKMVNTMVNVLLSITKKCRSARKYFGTFKTTHIWKAEII
ncbi:unnamed protein product, partial [Haemonchus placei]|uniref:Integrase catalytic domain-containing protein n=1 Tax=Haemonchus placei TaxID=6290 RepID=A0A0N4XAP6_HAEPC